EKEAVGEGARAFAEMLQPERRHGPEHERDERREDGDLGAVEERRHPFAVGKEGLVPAPGEPGRRQGDEARVVERGGDGGKDRQHEEAEDRRREGVDRDAHGARRDGHRASISWRSGTSREARKRSSRMMMRRLSAAAAARPQARRSLTKLATSMGRGMALAPPRRAGVRKKARASGKTMAAAAMRPGRLSGR